MDNVPNSFLIFASIMLGLEIVGLILCREKKEKRIEEVGNYCFRFPGMNNNLTFLFSPECIIV